MINETEPTERDGEAGAENESSDAADKLPGAPDDTESEAGDTDQHSSSDA